MALESQDDVYEKLAQTLHKIPNGFAIIPDGTHLKLLKWIFTSEEAFIASQMKLISEKTGVLATRLQIPEEELSEKLEVMIKKGQIRGKGPTNERSYSLIPFAVGIYEYQLGRMDKEFAQLAEDYFQKSKGVDIFSSSPPFFRVIPVNQAINPELNIHPYDEAEEILKKSKSWAVRDCICKEQQELLGNDCSYPKRVCITYSAHENAYRDGSVVQVVTREEALLKLKEARDAGLVHTTMNTQSDAGYICNCCTCCCGILRGLTEWEQPNAFANSNYVLSIDEELCTGCGICIDRCQFSALNLEDNVSKVNHRCVGCGVCVIECPEDALTLITRDPSDQNDPPATMVDWMNQRARARGVDPSELLR